MILFTLYLLPFTLSTFFQAKGPKKGKPYLSESMEPTQPISLSQIAGIALNDLRHYLSVIEPVIYQAPMDLLSGSSIGQHTRHIIEFYNCLIEQYTAADPLVINYSSRRRDYLIETAPDHALQNVNAICDMLNDLDTNKNCMLDCTEHGQDNLLVPTTIARELIYNIEHTIHHLAIVKIALKAMAPSIILPEHFGVAPSTMHYRQASCAQ